jgi:hypothetical protein
VSQRNAFGLRLSSRIVGARPGQAAARRFLIYFEEVCRIHLEDTGSALKTYKPTEPERLEAVFQDLLNSRPTGVEFLVELLHTLVWSQCLGNANHRTTVLFLQSTLHLQGISLPHYSNEVGASDRWGVAVNNFSDLSHRILDAQGEWGYGREQLRTQHRALCAEWLTANLGDDQSLVATTIEPQRFIAALSRGVSCARGRPVVLSLESMGQAFACSFKYLPLGDEAPS